MEEQREARSRQDFDPAGSAASLLAMLEKPAILLLDEDASIRFWNRGAEILYGWTAEEALGRRLTWLSAEGQADSSLVQAELAAVRMSGGEREERRRRRDGSTVTVTVRKLADPLGTGVWETSEALDASDPAKLLAAGVDALLGAELFAFDNRGTLSECLPSDARTRLSYEDLGCAQSLALRVLRTGEACEKHGEGGNSWLRACPISHGMEVFALVAIRSSRGSAGDGERELRRLTDLCRHLFDAQEAERRRLARELHDDLGQSLTSLLFSLESDSAPREQMRREASALLAKVRRLSQALRPGILDDLGLPAALQWLSDEHGRLYGTAVRLSLPGRSKRWPADLETALFRIAQEALTNAARHSSAKRIEIVVEDQNGELHMRIVDDGIGFELSGAALRSTGLESMRERALLLGGRFELSSQPGFGTRIEVSLPLLEEAAR